MAAGVSVTYHHSLLSFFDCVLRTNRAIGLADRRYFVNDMKKRARNVDVIQQRHISLSPATSSHDKQSMTPSSSSTEEGHNPQTVTLTHAKRSKGRDTRTWFDRLPDVLALHLIPSYLTLVDQCAGFSLVAKRFQAVHVLTMSNLEAKVLPRIGWVCWQHVYKKWSKQQLEEIHCNLMARRVACFCHTSPRYPTDMADTEDGREKQWQKLLHRSQRIIKEGFFPVSSWVRVYSCICLCNVRRFVPVIKKTVSGEKTILTDNIDERCFCVSGRANTPSAKTQPYNNRQPANSSIYMWPINSRRTDHEQFLQILQTIRFKMLVPKHGALNNGLIRDYLRRMDLLDLFHELLSRLRSGTVASSSLASLASSPESLSSSNKNSKTKVGAKERKRNRNRNNDGHDGCGGAHRKTKMSNTDSAKPIRYPFDPRTTKSLEAIEREIYSIRTHCCRNNRQTGRLLMFVLKLHL